MKRPAWVARRIETQKALKSLPRCEYTEGCEGRAMGIIRDPDTQRWKLACPRCAATAQLRFAAKARADAPRET